VAVTVAERYTDADVELVADVLWRYPSKTTTRAAATSVLDALVAAGWRPTETCPCGCGMRCLLAHGETGHG
jgi:hypothetical protein